MRMQMDQEFQQNEIKKLNASYNVEMFSAKLCEGKAFVQNKKFVNYKKILFKSKNL